MWPPGGTPASRDPQRLGDYLAHILESIERIERYTQGMTESAFLNDPLVQDAVVRNLEVIGEASHNIEKHAPAFAAAHPELPLAYACQMRNAVAHGYFVVDFALVWRTLRGDLPALQQRVRELLAALPPA